MYLQKNIGKRNNQLQELLIWHVIQFIYIHTVALQILLEVYKLHTEL